MTNTTLTVDNPLGLFDGCFAKLSNNDVVGPLLWRPDKGRFFLPNNSASWYPNGFCFGTRASIASLTVTPRETVKVPKPWAAWKNVYAAGGPISSVENSKAMADQWRSAERLHLLEIECRVVRVHFPDGTTQEVK